MNDYNAAFFGLYENVFNTAIGRYGLDETISLFSELMERGLSKSYGNDFKKGEISSFTKIVGQRDNNVGLKVSFVTVSDDEFVYRFHDDPFPNLKGKVEPKLLDSTYIPFKIRYILGEYWGYKTTKHLWNDDEYTEHVITRKKA